MLLQILCYQCLNFLSDHGSGSYVILVDLADSSAALVVIRQLLLSVSFMILCSGGPGRLC